MCQRVNKRTGLSHPFFYLHFYYARNAEPRFLTFTSTKFDFIDKLDYDISGRRKMITDEIKQLIIDTLDLEDITPEDIEDNAPLFVDGLGLDSIDALELGMALKKKYNITIGSDNDENKEYFYSVNTIADFINKQTKQD